MDPKSVLKRTALWMMLIIGGLCVVATTLLVSNKWELRKPTVVSPDTPTQATVVQGPDASTIHDIPNIDRLIDPPNSDEITESGSSGHSLLDPPTSSFQETLISKADRTTEIVANSTSPFGIAQNEADETEEEGSAAGGPDGARKFRNLQLRNQDGRIPLDGYEKAQDQLRAMKSRQTLEAKSKGKQDGSDIAGINSATWAWLGPGNIGGRIRSMVISPTNANSMWVGSVSGGIWHSTDAGASWLPVNDFMSNLAVSSLIFDPTNSNVMYAGTGEAYAAGSPEGEDIAANGLRGDGIFKSTDGGVTWNRMPTTRPSDPAVCGGPGVNCPWSYINRLAISPNGQNMLAATLNGIEITTNGGGLWQSGIYVSSGANVTGKIDDIDFDPQDSQKAIAGIDGGSLYSSDGGNSWTPATFTPAIATNGASGRVEMAYAPNDPDIVYASVDENGPTPATPTPTGTPVYTTQGDVYKSINGGRTFSLINASNPGNNFLGSQGFYDNIIWVNPLDKNFLIVGGINLYKSTDGGLNWVAIANGANGSAHSDHHMIVASPAFNNAANKQVYFTNDGGVYRADDVSTVTTSGGWTKLNNNLGITQFYSGVATAGGFIIGGTQDNGTIKFNGAAVPWTETFGGDGGFVAADPVDPNYLFGEYTYLAVRRSTNGGASGPYVFCNPPPASGLSQCLSPSTGITDANNGANFIAPIVLDPNNSNRLLGGGLSLWQSNDIKAAGLPTWTAIKPPAQIRTPVPPATAYPSPVPISPISAIAVSPNNPDLVVVGHNDGQIYLSFNSTNTPPNWLRIDTSMPATPSRFVTRLVIDETRSPSWIYATFGGFAGDNIYVTKNLGNTWADVSGSGATSIPSAPIRSLLINPIHRDWLYAGTELGVFASEDGGLTWGLPQDGPANVSVDELFWYNGRLAAATFGRGVYVTAPLFISNGGGGGGGGGGGSGVSCPLTGTGEWNDPMTWPLGQVPTASDDVAVVCPIKVNSSAVVRNVRVNSTLTVNSSFTTVEDIGNFGAIQPNISLPGNADINCRNLSNSGTMNNIHVLTASGDVVNGSTLNVNTIQSKGLRNAGSMNAVNVTVHGDFDNSGSMIGTGALAFTGGPTHNLQGPGQTKFPNGVIQSGETASLAGDITFDIGTFNSNGTMAFNGHTLNFIGGSYLSGGSALGPGTLNLAPTLGTAVLAGNAPGVNVASGLINYQSSGAFDGPLTVASGATFRLNAATATINGDATINGVITKENIFGGNVINFFGGTFTNNGGVTADTVRFNPFGPTPLAQNIAGAGVWSGGSIVMGNNLPATPSTVTLQNDTTFATNELQISYSFNLNGHVLTYTGIGSPGVSVGGLLAGPGTFKMQPSAGTPLMRMFPGATWNSDLTIASGTVRTNTAFGNFVVSGPLTVDAGATLRMDGVGNYFGNTVVNNGTINMMNGSSALQFRGSSFTNNGVIDATNVYFLPLAAQQMDLAGSGTWTGAGTLYLDPLASTRFTTDVTYGSGTLQTYGSLQGVNQSIFSVPCTVSWTGPGDVTGNIRRTNLAACPGSALRFGSPFTTITFNSGTPPSEVLVSAVSSPLVPVGFPNAVQRVYTITPTGGSGYSATLRLHYLDSELNGNDESTLDLFRFDGSIWTHQGATNRDPVDNWVEYSGVTQFSPWAISGQPPIKSTPTDTPTPAATDTLTPTATATNTPTPSGSPVISGTVTYGNAVVPPKFISNVLVTGTGSPIVTTTTDAPGGTAGQYSLTGFGAGSYTVTLSKTTGQNSITSNDAARIAQHVAGISTLNTTQKVVADVSNNGAVSSNDAALIARFVASLGAPIGNTAQWKFYLPPGPTFPVGSSPISRTYPSVPADMAGEDYVGLLIGDVSGNWFPSAARMDVSTQVTEDSGLERSVSVTLPRFDAAVDKEIVVPVNIQGVVDKDVISYEFDLRYDPSVIQPQANAVDLAGTVSRGLTLVANPNEPGLLRVVIYGAVPIDENGVLLNLRFTAVGKPGSVSPLKWERIMFNEGDPVTLASDGQVELSGQ